ncbi:putative neuromedin-U [Scophthalmus maximus]|uniref:Putative neuromedin-U n=1 Tax=Scophthalmus maximus TaxID=52904 RepID=A0A2U9C3N8_SCOMX|nr:putative neuromedin-U [Scophthalmus maximus]
MRRTMSSQSPPAQRGASSIISPHSLSLSISISSGGAMSPVSTASFTLAALLLLTTPVCHSAPVEVQQATTDQRQLFSQIDAVCSSYLSSDLKLWASDVLGELCVMMLVQKSKELKVQEKSKRTTRDGT